MLITITTHLLIFCAFSIADSFDDEEDSPDAVPFDDEDDEMSEEDEDTMFADMEEGIVDSDTRVTKEKTAEDFPEGKVSSKHLCRETINMASAAGTVC